MKIQICGFLIAVCVVTGIVSYTLASVQTDAVPILPASMSEVVRLDDRPPHVRNLLLRLDEAEKVGDVEMAVRAIEELRSLPGSPVDDLEDKLVRRLGELNLVLLFEMKCPRWVSLVTVKRGDTASSIASKFGSTVASLNCLNDNALDNMKAERSIYVLNQPRFRFVVHRRTQTADLYLNGKLFKRYDLKSVSGLKVGSCGWGEISLSTTDRKELEMLLTRNMSVLVSEM